MKYPDECPVFEVDGKHCDAIPCDCNAIQKNHMQIFDGGVEFEVIAKYKPLTLAARRLMRWTRL